MSDVFQLGKQASRSTFVSALKTLQSQGASILTALDKSRVDTLVEFDRRLQSVNARRTRAWRVIALEQVVKFVVSDFTDIDQANTTGTVRADSSSVSLRERAIPAEAVIKTNNFSANVGTIEALDASQSILRVHTDNGATPTGQFNIELITALTLNQLIIDIVATPSIPTIVAEVSKDGIVYTSSTQISLNGYRVTIWLPSVEAKFIRISVTPTLPDNLNSSTFTFGLTNFSAQATDFHLRSEYMSKLLTFSPTSEFVVFDAPTDSSIKYFLSLYGQGTTQAPFVEVEPGDALSVGTAVSQTVVTISSLGGLIASLPANVYINTIVIKENNVALKFAPGLLQTDTHAVELVNEYVGLATTISGYDLKLVNATANYSVTRTFDVSYVYGPLVVNAQLNVRLNTDDRATSPLFQGATLDSM
jgi:hypothetical protein